MPSHQCNLCIYNFSSIGWKWLYPQISGLSFGLVLYSFQVFVCFIRLLICNRTNYILHDFGQYNQSSKLLAAKFRLVSALFALILSFFPENMVHGIEMCVMWWKTVCSKSNLRYDLVVIKMISVNLGFYHD